MALILPDNKLIFIHIPKTGGKSISHAMGYLNQTNWDFYNDEQMDNTHVNSTYIKNRVGEFWNEAFKFAITRNEHDRLVSFYHYGTWKQLPNPFSSFTDFIYYVVGKKEVRLSASNQGWKYGRLNCKHFIKQPIDLIIDYNALDKGWEMVCNHLGREIELPHLNRSLHKSHLSYYTDETYKLIEQWSQQE